MFYIALPLLRMDTEYVLRTTNTQSALRPSTEGIQGEHQKAVWPELKLISSRVLATLDSEGPEHVCAYGTNARKQKGRLSFL